MAVFVYSTIPASVPASRAPARAGARYPGVMRARVLAAAHLRDLVEALRWLTPADAARLALAHPSRAVVVEGLADPGPVCAALDAAGVPYARASDALAWAADPARTAEAHRQLREAAPEVFDALSLALARWGEPPADVPLPNGGTVALSRRVHVMGVVNVTPDSFSDGGLFSEPDDAIDHGLRLAEEGADLLDVGGESTRPGAEPVDADEETRRILPVIEALAAKAGVPVSIDTSKAAVARRALDAGAQIVNDVSAGRFDPDLLPLVAERGAAVVLMHMQGEPPTMQREPRYGDVVGEVAAYLGERAGAAQQAGIPRERIVIDPGFGFGKRWEHNLVLLQRLREFRCLGFPLLVGTSRKSFIGATLGGLAVDERLEGTAATVALAVANGASIVRVHDVRAMTRVVRMVEAVISAAEPPDGNDLPK